MLRPPTLRPLMLVIPYFLIQQFAGMASIRPFMVHVFRQLGLDDAAEWTTVIGQFSHTRNCVNIHALASEIRLLLFQPNSNYYNLCNILLIYSGSCGCFIRRFVTEILLTCKLYQPKLVTFFTEYKYHKYIHRLPS
jgi:hypothetical protein